MVPEEGFLFRVLEADRTAGRFYECRTPVFLLEA
jgi:hypothetical protein